MIDNRFLPELQDYLNPKVHRYEIINYLENIEKERQRIVDFVLGVCFATGANFTELGANIISITPKGFKVRNLSEDKEETNSSYEIFRKKTQIEK